MRINVLHPSLLTDQHLIAEYREIKMLPKAFLRSYKSKNGLGVFGGDYRLNSGHGKSLYDKFLYIEKRFNSLIQEMRFRNFTTNFTEISLNDIPKEFKNDYIPTQDAIRINSERIIQRVKEKPSFYKYHGKRINTEKYIKILSNLTVQYNQTLGE